MSAHRPRWRPAKRRQALVVAVTPAMLLLIVALH